eukprot:TRINITY_DN595_c0_g1_i6.p1 TRINITY_DN595_c0_g1~~TRINITY_DN595_c0_g1_i6.p1  ORF type:complete len:215 (-),score=52.72 TRINITY_DN595_c0_g1_i6:17-661(-)
MKKVKRGKKPEVKSTPECKVSKAPVAYEDSVLSKYSDSPSGISPEGLLALCKDADLNMHSDAEVLALLYVCGSKKYGAISKEELKVGLSKLGIKTATQWKGLKKKLSEICSESNIEEYKAFYNFVFNYHMMVPGQKTLDKDGAIGLLEILMKKTHPISQKFVAFLKQSERKVINRDQWQNLISLFTSLEKGEQYDTSGAWPSLYDEFHEWMLKN